MPLRPTSYFGPETAAAVVVSCAEDGTAPQSMATASTNAAVKLGKRRANMEWADWEKGEYFFKRTRCMVKSYLTIYRQAHVAGLSPRHSSPANSRIAAIPAAPTASQLEAFALVIPPSAKIGMLCAATQ